MIPDFANLTLKSFVSTVIDAMGQLFYSLSVAMGIMITYGSYVKKETDLNKSINQIEIFDTIVAFCRHDDYSGGIYFHGKRRNVSVRTKPDVHIPAESI